MQRRLSDVTGWVLLAVAVVLHRVVASKRAWQQWQSWRDVALLGAYRRGVPVPELAGRLGLSEGWVRQVINGKKPPEVEEAA